MHYKNHILKTAVFVSLSTLVIFPLINMGASLAQSNTTQREGLPLRRVGGGTRGGGCYYRSQTLTALVPNTVGKTVSASPELFFYVPKNRKATDVEFVLRDSSDRLIYETTITTNESGLVSFQVPNSQTTQLQTGESYRWYVSMICNPQNRSQDLVVEGWIKRVEMSPSLASQLQQADPNQVVELYQQADIWYDALATAAELKSETPSDRAVAQWQELLRSIGLQDLSQVTSISTPETVSQSTVEID